MKLSELETTEVIKFLISSLSKKDFEKIEIFVAERSKTNMYRFLNIAAFLALKIKQDRKNFKYYHAVYRMLYSAHHHQSNYKRFDFEKESEYQYKGIYLYDMTVAEFSKVPDSFLLKFQGIGEKSLRIVRKEINKYCG
jgi:hypothetical protein